MSCHRSVNIAFDSSMKLYLFKQCERLGHKITFFIHIKNKNKDNNTKFEAYVLIAPSPYQHAKKINKSILSKIEWSIRIYIVIKGVLLRPF